MISFNLWQPFDDFDEAEPAKSEARTIQADLGCVGVKLNLALQGFHSIGVENDIVLIRFVHGTALQLGPYDSPTAAEDVMSRVVGAIERSHDRRPTPTTKAEYLHALSENAWTFPCVGEMQDPPADWIADAWDLPSVQSDYLYGGILRDYSKGHGLACSKQFLATLSRSLRPEQIAEFYLRIRRVQPTREMEFRDDFLAAFADHAAIIPPQLTADEWEEAIFKEEGQRRAWRQRQFDQDFGDSDENIPF